MNLLLSGNSGTLKDYRLLAKKKGRENVNIRNKSVIPLNEMLDQFRHLIVKMVMCYVS